MRLNCSFSGSILKLKEVDRFDEEAAKEAKARRVVRNNNFTQQTNTLDVDKHMYALRVFRSYRLYSSSKDGLH